MRLYIALNVSAEKKNIFKEKGKLKLPINVKVFFLKCPYGIETQLRYERNQSMRDPNTEFRKELVNKKITDFTYHLVQDFRTEAELDEFISAAEKKNKKDSEKIEE